jgi:hypothetical protein
MGKTWKDSPKGTTLRVDRDADGTFCLFLNNRLDRTHLNSDGLHDELCVRYGYCQQELAQILQELNETGTSTRNF